MTIIEGKLTRDVEMFGKQDPYVKLEYLGIKYKTKVHESGGKTPAWNETFVIPLGSISDELHIECKDDDVVGAKMIGSTNIKASALCFNNGVRDWFTFSYEGNSIGQILLSTKFVPKNQPVIQQQP